MLPARVTTLSKAISLRMGNRRFARSLPACTFAVTTRAGPDVPNWGETLSQGATDRDGEVMAAPVAPVRRDGLLEDVALEPVPTSGHREGLSWTPLQVGVTMLVTFTVLWRAWTMSAWSWFMDDWVYLTRTAEMPFWSYITQEYNGHIMPGQFLLAWVSTKLAPLDYTWAVVAVIAMMVASIVVWSLALTALFGERLRLLYALTVLALSPLFMPISLWWAAAIQVFPLQLAMGASVLFTVRYLTRGGHRADLVGLGLSYALGLFFWQKALLITVPVVFVVLLLRDGPVLAVLRKNMRLLLVPTLITIAYLPLFLTLTRGDDGARTKLFQPRSVGESLSFYLHGIIDVGLPALVGGPWSSVSNPQAGFEFGRSSTSFLLVAVAVAVGGLALAYRRRGGAAVAMVVAYATIAWGLLLTSSRYEVMGNLSIYDARYAADILPVALLGSMFLVTPTRLERAQGSWLRQGSVPTMLRRSRVLLVPLLLAVGAGAIWSNGATWDLASQRSPKPWVDNLVADAGRVGGATVYNSMAPAHVILSAFFWGDGRISQLLKPLGLPLDYNQPSPSLLIVDDQGHLRPVEVEAVSRSASPPPVEGCGYLVRPGETTYVPLSVPMYAWEWGVQLDYFSQKGGNVVLAGATKTVAMEFAPGLGHIQAVLEDELPALTLRGDPASGPICLTEVRVGPLRPAPAAPGS